jgi:hypothetical protein
MSRRCSKLSLQPFTTTRLAIIPSWETKSPSFGHISSYSYNMDDQSGSAHFQTLFGSALQAYEKKTGMSLAEHPLVAQLQDCHSVESITTLLQHQAKNFSDFRGKNKIMRTIESTVSILSTLSANSPLGGSIGLVRQNALIEFSTSLTTFISGIPTHKCNTSWARRPPCRMCISFLLRGHPCDNILGRRWCKCKL